MRENKMFVIGIYIVLLYEATLYCSLCIKLMYYVITYIFSDDHFGDCAFVSNYPLESRLV